MTNTDLNSPRKVLIDAGSIKGKNISAEILTSADIKDYNDFGKAEKVTLKKFNGVKTNSGKIEIEVPARSIITVTIK